MRKLIPFAILLASSGGYANGRAPITNGVFFRPGDAQSIYVPTTFGLLLSHDDGCTFHWVCEQDVGYGGSFDPHYAVASDGTIFATTFTGLRVSHDGACSFTTATAELPMGDPGRIADIWIDALDIGPTGEVWVATAESGKPNNVYRSTDNGAAFSPKGMQSATIWWKSVRVAPSNAQRIYLAGYEVAGTAPDGGELPPAAHLLRSDDDGTTWSPMALTGVTFGQTPTVHVLAVSPTAADTVLLRSVAANPPTGDRLYRSTDGGQTFTEVLATTDPITDVVYRDPMNVLVVTAAGSVYSSSDGAVTLTQVTNAPKLVCLGQRSDGQLFGCGPNWQPDFMSVARSTDGATWTKVFRFVNLAGAMECPGGTAGHDMCDQQLWPTIQEQFGTTGPTCGPEVRDGTIDAGPVKTSTGKGCCDTGGGGAGSIGLAVATVAACIRRRRRRR